MNFFSHRHPDILLKDHLKTVGETERNILLEKRINNLDKQFLSDVAYLIGISHDFGKFTTFFQEYLEKKRRSEGLTHHGLISALFTYEVLSEFIRIRKYENHALFKYIPFFGYIIVKHHHGNLDAIEKDVNSEQLLREFSNIREQLSDVRRNDPDIKEIYSVLFLSTDIQVQIIFNNLSHYEKECQSPEILDNVIKHLRKDAYFFKKESSNQAEPLPFLIIQLLYSVLIDSDKKHAGHVEEIRRPTLPSDIVEKYKANPEFQKANSSNINRIRNEIFESVILTIQQSTDKKIFSITAPTGTGKTLTSFSAALKLKNISSTPQRIVYALPFTSIIDQNFKVLEDVLQKTLPDFKTNESPYLLKHHHLAEFKYRYEGENKPVDESLALIESWDSEIIVTTFIQFFYSTIGYENKFLKKFHNIAGSIIILDEVQNIPIKYWRVIGSVLAALSKYFDCTIILLTATQPLLFEKDECTELVKNHEKYFSNADLNRVLLRYDENQKTIEDMISELKISPEKSYLFVLNTIRSSIDFFTQISEKLGYESPSKNPIEYLSTNIIPKERHERISRIKSELDSGQKKIIVTTQLIEAGVDIDVDVVYRDIGPLDSIIQVAGRCNRKKRVTQGEVHILNLVDVKNRPYSKIYDKVLLNIVHQIFKDHPTIEETQFIEIINLYFNKSQEKVVSDEKIMSALFELNYHEKREDVDFEKRVPISEFKLIDDDLPDCDVFIEVDNIASKTWNQYLEIQTIQDTFERKKQFLTIKKEFYEYVISIPSKDAKSIVDTQYGISRIPYSDVEKYYEMKIGFKRGNPVISIFG
ncbi:CRISPR-associated helicase/endonuclease Cas3 [Methanoregula formicica]|uniref:CRISPR-associated helicase Cas3/CRISPR-associated endonuclease Cas3-HD n=1 Tax=Methanoregula formicica (strain DSM 22288 / NBRC 105244 / SMSP) TaxID=593750 RepID=L0HEM1_METFS|nr:CRISPR-associated helicase/endonuclease Cas3 [Methanoregula formicica]AGB03157.1 CRISPR-associated helicase Cas3/CRISPR-associated endonuclease Cas3-HD [Methanoregula formicica SMSP]